MATQEQQRERRSDLTADELRQGEIILDTRRRRTVFIAGLVGFVLLALFGGLVWI